MRKIREQMPALVELVGLADYQRTRGVPPEAMFDPTKAIYNGIKDLDFDPTYFLGTGQTSAEGWAVQRNA